MIHRRGHALELALGRPWREHSDIDVGIRRDELSAVHGFLADWDLHVPQRVTCHRGTDEL